MSKLLAMDASAINMALNSTIPDGLFEPFERSNPVGNIAVISIYGTLSHRNTGFFAQIFGLPATTYREIGEQFGRAIRDESIDAILLEIDSPGGEASGLFDLADMIYSARGVKPIYAIANESALSAAYALASAADKVFLTRTSDLGSVGVIAVHVDQSKYDADAGLKYTLITAGDHKAEMNPHAPLTDAALASIQAAVDTTYDLFATTVARNRGLTVEAVKAMEAAIFTGQAAIDAGLADGISTYNSTLDHLMGGNMSLKDDVQKLLAGKTPEEIREAMGEFSQAPTGAQDTSAEIIGLCELAGITDMAFVKGLLGLSVEAARAKILEAKADQTQVNIFSTVSALSTGEVNPLLEDAKKRGIK